MMHFSRCVLCLPNLAHVNLSVNLSERSHLSQTGMSLEHQHQSCHVCITPKGSLHLLAEGSTPFAEQAPCAEPGTFVVTCDMADVLMEGRRQLSLTLRRSSQVAQSRSGRNGIQTGAEGLAKGCALN